MRFLPDPDSFLHHSCPVQVFYDAAHVSTSMAVVGSPLDSFKEWSAGAGSAWTGAAAFAPGLAGTLKNLPANFSHTFILHLAGSPGVTQAIHEYGQLIQAYYKTYKIKDITLTKIGYQVCFREDSHT